MWPWYSQIAPVKWLVVHDVDEGRQEMNFSTGRRIEADEMIENIEREEMPPRIYLPLHPEANLSAEQKAALYRGDRSHTRSLILKRLSLKNVRSGEICVPYFAFFIHTVR